MFWGFGGEACGILAPQPGIEPTPPALESELDLNHLTTGPPGKSWDLSSCYLLLHVAVSVGQVTSSLRTSLSLLLKGDKLN